jgi:polysaccharide deacetylase family protein (PEP-CTERM system associated)
LICWRNIASVRLFLFLAGSLTAILHWFAELPLPVMKLQATATDVNNQTAAEFRDDLICSKAILEELTGQEVIGYRAPSFSLGLSTPWAHAIIGECGYLYSSSVFPVQHGPYGVPNSPRFPYRIQPNVVEIPVSSIRLFGYSLPGPGGGFFRLYPYALSRWAMQRLNRDEGASALYYCRLWEIDPEQPKAPDAPLHSRTRH